MSRPNYCERPGEFFAWTIREGEYNLNTLNVYIWYNRARNRRG